MDFFGEYNTPLSLVLMMAVVLLFLRWSQRRLKQSAARTQKLRQPRAEAPRVAHNLDSPGHVARWEIEMHELARDLTAQLDTKIAILQQLIRTAEERIVRLERLTTGERPAVSHAENAPPASEPATALPKSSDARCREIFQLADSGYTSAAIAGQVGTPVGEIELILSLRAKD